MNKAVRIRLSILVILFVIAFSVWLPFIALPTISSNSELTVRFLDVGQGDAVQVITPDGYEMLIDGGPSAAVLRELDKGRSFFDKKIDVVIATHPDTDHVAGLVDVLERYKVDWLIESGAKGSSPAATAYDEKARAEGAQIILAQAGQVIQLGASTTVQILSPLGETVDWEKNTSSVVVRIVYGEIEFILTGDAPSGIEDYLVSQYGDSLQSDVLKLGHHGSKTATSELFLDSVKPEYAVVSAGLDNRYGHPNVDVVKKVLDRNIKIVNTAESGTLVFKSDGERVWVKQ